MNTYSIEEFFNETNVNYSYYFNNDNKISNIMIFTSLSILLLYSLINSILDNPKKILEDIKTKEIKEYKNKYYDELQQLENKEYNKNEMVSS